MYDVTSFLENHPGGPGIILANAGKDATFVHSRVTFRSSPC